MVPGVVAYLLFRADGFDPAPLPDHHSWFVSLAVPARNDRMLQGAERLADGLLAGPEDLVSDANGHFLYTGCADGWVKRLRLSEAVASVSVENWTYVAGRPIGLAIGADNQLIVADAFKVNSHKTSFSFRYNYNYSCVRTLRCMDITNLARCRPPHLTGITMDYCFNDFFFL